MVGDRVMWRVGLQPVHRVLATASVASPWIEMFHVALLAGHVGTATPNLTPLSPFSLPPLRGLAAARPRGLVSLPPGRLGPGSSGGPQLLCLVGQQGATFEALSSVHGPLQVQLVTLAVPLSSLQSSQSGGNRGHTQAAPDVTALAGSAAPAAAPSATPNSTLDRVLFFFLVL